MEANEPNTTNQTTYMLLNNELEKIQGRLDDLNEKLEGLNTGIQLIIGLIKRQSTNKKSLVDSLPDDIKLDILEDHEGTCMDFSRVSNDQLSNKELEPFTLKTN